MNIIMASDDRGIDMMLVAIYSVIKNNSDFKLCFYIVHTDLSDMSQNRIRRLSKKFSSRVTIQFVTANKNLFKNIELTNNEVTMPAYYRYLAPDILRKEDKVLYMDIDMMCIDSLKQLYDINLDGYYVAAVEDYFVSRSDDYPGFKEAIGFAPNDKYANSGLQLMNLSKMRQDGIMSKFWKNIHHKSDIIPAPFNIFADQTVMNITFKNKIKFISEEYNVMTTALKYTKQKKATVVHFTGPSKPFTYRDQYSAKYNDIYYDYYDECMGIAGSNKNAMIKNAIRRLGNETSETIKRYKDVEQIVRDKTNHVTELNTEIEKYQIKLKNAEEKLSNASMKLEDSARAIQGYEASRSWRVTYPLRLIGKYVKNIIQ